jgi:hypothetical protein
LNFWQSDKFEHTQLIWKLELSEKNFCENYFCGKASQKKRFLKYFI